MSRPSLPLSTTVTCLALVLAAAPTSAQQRYSAAVTFQASIAEYSATLRALDYRSYGIMVGVERPGRWWSPNLWLQRYDLLNICLDPAPGGSGCKGDGWSLSIGPSLQFVDSRRVKGYILPQVGLDSRDTQEFTGGAGVHIGWDAGLFQPQAFGRFQTLRGWSFVTVGVGLRMELSALGGEGPQPGR